MDLSNYNPLNIDGYIFYTLFFNILNSIIILKLGKE